MGCIHIGPVSLDCFIGVDTIEHRTKQTVKVTVILHCNLQSACQSDQIEDTVANPLILERIKAGVTKSSFHLIEALAQHIAKICLADNRVTAVDVTVEKPHALPDPVAVKIHRINTPTDTPTI